jgi:hypothetical protein
MSFKLLTTSNLKIIKGEKQGYKSYILHLAPSDLSGVMNTCPKASLGCKLTCLNTAGHGGMFKAGETTNTVQEARIRRTRFFASDRAGFMNTLISDVTKAIKQAERKGMIPVFRLNGTSDLSWEKYLVDGKNIFEHFPRIQFYDYTKVLGRKVKHIPNYHLTFSRSEDNDADVMKAMEQGYSIAVVFDEVPATWNGVPVVDGDLDDLRFNNTHLDLVIGLKAKGRAKKDTTGFVVRVK